MQAIEVKLQLMEAALQIQEDPEVPVKLVMFINEIDEATYQATVKPYIKLDYNDKTQYKNEWCTHRERVAILEKQRGQAFSMVISHCTQILMDKMKHDTDCYTASTSYDPLKFMALI